MGDYNNINKDPKEFRKQAEERGDFVLDLFVNEIWKVLSICSHRPGREFTQIGFMLIKRETMEIEYGWKLLTKNRKRSLLEIAEDELNTYNMYLSGEVYGYTTEDPEGNCLDGVWGIYGYEQVKDQALKDLEFYAHYRESILRNPKVEK